MKRLGRDSLIQIAKELLQDIREEDENFDLESFERTTVWQNKEQIIVSFEHPIKYIPLKSSYYYDISVDVVSRTISQGPISNPASHPTDNAVFFKATQESERAIQFVIDAINKESGIKEDTKAFIEDLQGYMIIRDTPEFYEISRITDYQESVYKIDKQTGEVFDEMHGHLMPPPDHRKIEEIKE